MLLRVFFSIIQYQKTQVNASIQAICSIRCNGF